MKKSTLENIVKYLNGETVDVDTLREEVNAEWEKSTAKARNNAALYAEAKEIVLGALSVDTALTLTDLYKKVCRDLPNGFSKSKVQYGLNNYWANDIVKGFTTDAQRQYSLKAE